MLKQSTDLSTGDAAIAVDQDETTTRRNTSGVINRHPATIPASNQVIGTLTRRETEVLKLLAGGQNAGEIATAMSICVATVCNHIQHVLCKMRVHSRLEAVLLGKQLDLI